MPLLSVQVSGLWQNWQRNMHAVVQATRRIPGPSTAEPVVNECRKPMSPVLSAVRTSVSPTSSPRWTRISYGLFASSGVAAAVSIAGSSVGMERAVDHVHLLLAGQADEVDRVARHADRQARVFLRVVDRIEQRVAVQHVDVHVIAGHAEIGVEDRGQV